MTCEGEQNSAIAMSARPTPGLLPHAVCNAAACPSAYPTESHLSHGIPLWPRDARLRRSRARL